MAQLFKRYLFIPRSVYMHHDFVYNKMEDWKNIS